MSHAIKRQLIAGSVLVASIAGPLGIAAAQSPELTNYFADPGVIRSEAMEFPTHSISTQSIVVGDWSIKAVYRHGIQGNHVVGLLASANETTLLGDNIGAVFYERPELDCDLWSAKIWEGAKPWEAAGELKLVYGIPDVQDDYWEVLGGPELAGLNVSSYEKGFDASDGLGAVVNGLESESREIVLSALKDSGYPVANIPFEAKTSEELRGWLLDSVHYFESVLVTRMSDQQIQAEAIKHFGPRQWQPTPCIDPTWECVQLCWDLYRWMPSQFVPPPGQLCNPISISGDWELIGNVCGCRTEGPWSAVCGTFTGDASGEITVLIPNPLMKVKLTVGIGAEVHVCVCLWKRTCFADARRVIWHLRHDCTWWSEEQFVERRRFTHYDYMIAYPADQCQHSAMPDSMPPNEDPCGLTNEN